MRRGGEITVCPSLGMTSFTEISKEKLKIQAEDRYFDTNKYHLSWKENGQEKLGGESTTVVPRSALWRWVVVRIRLK